VKPRPAPEEGYPKIHKEHVTKENVNEIFARHQVPHDVDVCVIDIDGNDYWVWEALNYEPRILMIEYNPHFSLEESVAMKYIHNYAYRSNIRFGASFTAMRALGEAKGYQLVEEVAYNNLIFVRVDIKVNPRLVVPSLPCVPTRKRLPRFFVEV
jgi:hypothetical protein